MASIITRPNGTKYIQLTNVDKRRCSVWLNTKSQREAERIRDKIEQLLSARSLNQPIPKDMGEWVADLPEGLANRLVELDLIDKPQNVARPKLVEFVDAYIAKRTDTKPNTLIVYGRCRNLLASYFKAKRLDEITVADAKDFARWMTTKEKATIDLTHQAGIEPTILDGIEPSFQIPPACDHRKSR